MKHTIYLLSSDTSNGTNAEAFATESARDDRLLAIMIAEARGNNEDWKELMTDVSTATPTDRHAAIQCAWDYFDEHIRGHLDTYCQDDVELDLPAAPDASPFAAAPGVVVVNVLGGVAYAAVVPAGITLQIHDYDSGGMLEHESPAGHNADGQPYTCDTTIGPY